MQGARGGGNASHLAQARQRSNRSSRDVVPRHLQHTQTSMCNTHLQLTSHSLSLAPLSPLPLNCFFRSRIRDVFVTVLRCISVATFLLLAARSVMVSPGHLVSPLRWSRVRVYHVFRAPAPCPTLSTGKGSRIQFAISFLGRSPPPTPTVIRIWIRVRTRSRIWLQHSSGF